MTFPTPQDAKLQGFQDLTQGYQQRPKPNKSDALLNVTCGGCGSELVYKTLNNLYAKDLPFNCINCGLLSEKGVIQG